MREGGVREEMGVCAVVVPGFVDGCCEEPLGIVNTGFWEDSGEGGRSYISRFGVKRWGWTYEDEEEPQRGVCPFLRLGRGEEGKRR